MAWHNAWRRIGAVRGSVPGDRRGCGKGIPSVVLAVAIAVAAPPAQAQRKYAIRDRIHDQMTLVANGMGRMLGIEDACRGTPTMGMNRIPDIADKIMDNSPWLRGDWESTFRAGYKSEMELAYMLAYLEGCDDAAAAEADRIKKENEGRFEKIKALVDEWSSAVAAERR